MLTPASEMIAQSRLMECGFGSTVQAWTRASPPHGDGFAQILAARSDSMMSLFWVFLLQNNCAYGMQVANVAVAGCYGVRSRDAHRCMEGLTTREHGYYITVTAMWSTSCGCIHQIPLFTHLKQEHDTKCRTHALTFNDKGM
jgi:hypothetical protein